jgi:GAF domain-containing protein
MDMTQETELARTFVALADTLVADFDVVELLQRLVEETVRLLDSAEAGLLMADSHGRLLVLASTSEQTRLLELFQLQADVGPCLECYSTGRPVLVADLERDGQRWPVFTAEALEAGYRSVHALPMRLRSETIGAFNLFNTRSGSMAAHELNIAQALADVATIGILQQRALARRELLNEQLQLALNSRVIIEQAKGVLAERGAIDMSEAFNRLRGYARNHSERLVDTARAVVDGDITPGALIRSANPGRRS